MNAGVAVDVGAAAYDTHYETCSVISFRAGQHFHLPLPAVPWYAHTTNTKLTPAAILWIAGNSSAASASANMDQPLRNPLLAPAAIFLVALSLSIGWGIRGNFGHEAGAMMAGVLSATAVAVLSRRDDWQNRVGYFAMLGGLGWGFGGSIAYMYPISFTESGHTASTYYGYFSLFLEGGLWCGMGAAGTALAAAMPLGRLTKFITPLCFVLAAMGLKHFIEAPLEGLLIPGAAGAAANTWHRQESPLYWFDADWLPALMALLGVCVYDLYDRWRHRENRLDNPVMVLPFAAIGAVVGFLAQLLLRTVGLEDAVRNALVVRLGDLSYISTKTGKPFDPDQLLTNWPIFFSDYPQHLGWLFGLILGLIVYFYKAGKFRNDASLLLSLSLGWFIGFFAMPVLGSIFLMEYGGFRLMPPRSDDWAGIVGVFIAGIVWTIRRQLKPVAHVMSLGFLLGGLSFASVPMIRYLVRYPGHPYRFPNGVPDAWRHFQSANWHSVLEQSHGFGHGLAIAIAMALLWRRQPYDAREAKVGGWTVPFSIFFAWCVIGFLNLYKLVETWIEKQAIPATLKAPFLGFLEATPLTWFNVVWWAASAVCLALLFLHQRRRLEVVPASWVGKGQLIYLVFLWLIVVGNLCRAIPGFDNGRMVTEWVIFMNASLATLLIVALPGRAGQLDAATLKKSLPEARPWPWLTVTWILGLLFAIGILSAYGYSTLALYQKHLEGKPYANHRRFGPDAKWRVDPILKHGEHP